MFPGMNQIWVLMKRIYTEERDDAALKARGLTNNRAKMIMMTTFPTDRRIKIGSLAEGRAPAPILIL
jgi:hypothetical protein